MKLGTALRLGRVSNLPTVWTNTLAGAVLAGAGGFGWEFAAALLAFSLFYTGGMFLNDAFDAPFDAVQRPERPIPSGEIGARAVFTWGFGQMALGIAVLAAFGVAPALAGLTLAVAITFYDWHHKKNIFGPVVMGLCRVLVYVGAGLCYTLALPDALWLGAALMLCYLIGLTYVAKQENLGRVENLWPLLFLAAPVAYGAWLAASDVPKLFVNADPGSILTGRPRDFCRTWANQREVTVPGDHFVPEDSPDDIGRALADWIPTLSG